MAYKSKFIKQPISDDSTFVGGIVYDSYTSQQNSIEEYDFLPHRLNFPLTASSISQTNNLNEDEVVIEDVSANESNELKDTINEEDVNVEEAKEKSNKEEGVSSRKIFSLKPGLENRYETFVTAYMQSGAPENELPFWSDLAQRESGFQYSIVGRHKGEQGDTVANGLFQLLTEYKGGPMNNVGRYSNVSTEKFLSDPIIQIRAAQNMKQDILSQFTKADWDAAKAMGYTASAMIAGAWAGGVGGVRKWLHQKKNAVDILVKNNPDKRKQWESSVGGRMEAFNNYFKHGGVIKFGDGGKDDGLSRGRQFIDEWYDSRTDLLAKNFNEQYPWLLTNGNLINNLIKINLSNINSYVDSNKVPNGAKGVYRPNRKELVISDPDDTSTAIHEYAHGVTEFNDSIINKVSDIISGMGSGLYMNSSIKPDAYLDDPAEIYSRLMQLRHFLSEEGIDPKKKFTVDAVRNLIDTYTNKTHLHNSKGITTFDSSGNIIRHDPTKSTEDWKIERSVDYRVGDLDLLFRYNPHITTKLLNEVAILPKTSNIQKAQNGLKVVTQDSQNNWVLSEDWHAPLLPIYVNSIPDADSSVKGFSNAKDVYEHILTLPGSNPAIAAGWTGVFMKESGLDHNAVNKSSGASGIAQLLGSRRNEYKRWLNGKSDTWQNQISWVWEKINNGTDDWQTYYDALKKKVDNGESLSTDEQSHWNSMSKSKYINYSFKNYRDKINSMYDPGDIAELMTWTFERPGDKEAHIDQRRDYANSVYNQFNY